MNYAKRKTITKRELLNAIKDIDMDSPIVVRFNNNLNAIYRINKRPIFIDEGFNDYVHMVELCLSGEDNITNKIGHKVFIKKHTEPCKFIDNIKDKITEDFFNIDDLFK